MITPDRIHRMYEELLREDAFHYQCDRLMGLMAKRLGVEKITLDKATVHCRDANAYEVGPYKVLLVANMESSGKYQWSIIGNDEKKRVFIDVYVVEGQEEEFVNLVGNIVDQLMCDKDHTEATGHSTQVEVK